jgi:gamma-glutamyltranspeptidase / glutathione hydrolase
MKRSTWFVVALIVLAAACAPAAPDTARVPTGRPGTAEVTLSPATWDEADLRRTMDLFSTQRASGALVESERGMVVTAVAAPGTHAGVLALRAGGSAVDAVLTAALTNTALSLGTGMSYAGVASLVYYEAATGQVHSMDAAWNTVRGETDPLSIPADSPSGRTALVPGFMAGVEAAHARFGRLPFRVLFEPAIHFAEQGTELPPVLERAVRNSRNVLERLPETRGIFTGPDGEWYAAGDRVRQPELAATLRRVAAEGAAYMYTGEWGRKMVAAVQREGGHMTLEDLAAYEVIWSEPAHARYGDHDVYAPGAPAYGGVNIVEALHLLEQAGVRELGHPSRSAEALYRFMRVAHVQHVMNWVEPDIRAALMPELDGPDPVRGTREHARALWAAMNSEAWTEVLEADDRRRRGGGADGHTDAVVAVDPQGNVAALTYTTNTGGWGRTGIFVDGVSIPDPASFSQTLVARTAPGERLPIGINPVIVLKEGKPVLASAAIGPAVHETTLQNLTSVLDFDMDPASASQAPEFLLYVYASIRQLVGDVPVHTRTVPAGAFPAVLLDSVRALGQPVVEVTPERTGPLRGGWIGIRRDPVSGRLQGVAASAWGGLAEGY